MNSNEGTNAVSAKWVYSWKVNELEHVVRAKARLVARDLRSVRALTSLRPFRHVLLLRAFDCWLLSRVSLVGTYAILMPSKRLFSQSWMRLCSSVFPLIAVSSPVRLSS